MKIKYLHLDICVCMLSAAFWLAK